MVTTQVTVTSVGSGKYFRETVRRFRLRLSRVSLFIFVFFFPLQA